jgi:anti-sigma regulatory factor (Ser/Thr protein kinase)
VLCAIVDQVSGHVRYSTAGHVPGILVHTDGSSALLDKARSVPLATVQARGRPQATAAMRPGSALLLYTDGLIDRRGDALGNGITRALDALLAARHQHQDVIAERVVAAALPDQGPEDDVALLVYRHADTPPFQLPVPATPVELSRMRALLSAWLVGAGADDDDILAVQIATSEACANAIEHGYRFSPGGIVHVHAAIHAGRLEVLVRDSGRWLAPSGRGVGRGRGLRMIEALMDSSVVDPTPHGTTVRLVKDIHRAH